MADRTATQRDYLLLSLSGCALFFSQLFPFNVFTLLYQEHIKHCCCCCCCWKVAHTMDPRPPSLIITLPQKNTFNNARTTAQSA